MAKVPGISESEWKVMKVLWARSPLPSNEIIEALADKEDWHPNTVKTLLARLHKKKAVGVQKEKNHYLYSPLVSQADCVQTESESFLMRVFGGSVKPLLMHFVDKQKLSSADLEELKSILKKKK
ncbi:MAG: putative transcriptional regulator [Pedosphaera sp.]|nr:putative transcriptional regulator [Pedosphaera sp.]